MSEDRTVVQYDDVIVGAGTGMPFVARSMCLPDLNAGQ
jgi:hypothetical protein